MTVLRPFQPQVRNREPSDHSGRHPRDLKRERDKYMSFACRTEMRAAAASMFTSVFDHVSPASKKRKLQQICVRCAITIN